MKSVPKLCAAAFDDFGQYFKKVSTHRGFFGDGHGQVGDGCFGRDELRLPGEQISVFKFKHSKLHIPSALCHRIRILKDSAQPQPRMRITALSKAGGDGMGAGTKKGVVKGTRQERV